MTNTRCIFFAIVMALVLVWLGASVHFFVTSNAEFFQRMGSFGVFSLLLMLTQGNLDVELSERERLQRIDKEKEKITLETVTSGLNPKGREETIKWLIGNQKYAFRRKIFFFRAEMILIGIATLQWGFGDVLVRHAFRLFSSM